MLKKKDGDEATHVVEVPSAKLLGKTSNQAVGDKSADSSTHGNKEASTGNQGRNRPGSKSVSAASGLSNEPKANDKPLAKTSARTVQARGRSDRRTPTPDPVDEALAAADYKTLTAEEAMEHMPSMMPTSKLSKQKRALLQEQDRREQYLGEFLDGEVNVSWRVAVIVLLAFIAIAAAKTWADAFMSLSLFMFGYLLHVTITIVRLKRDADV